jgi:hypothetical protein
MALPKRVPPVSTDCQVPRSGDAPILLRIAISFLSEPWLRLFL